MHYSMFIDDERFPSDKSSRHFQWITRSSQESIEIMKKFGCPIFISFDHDLGGDDTSMKVVHWMIDLDLNSSNYGELFIPENFMFDVHSQNPIGAKNIKQTLNSYLRFREENANIRV